MRFFKEAIHNESSIYSDIRDYPGYCVIKNQIEDYWKIYKSYAPKNFLKLIQNKDDFYQRWWEMYLGVGLLNIGISIITSPEDEGPDFRIQLSANNLWIEAVAPKPGIGDDLLPKLLEGYHSLPEKEFLLRITNSMNEKIIQYKKRRRKKIIGTRDLYIIAISACALNQFGSLMNFPVPAPLKILTGANNLVIQKKYSYIQRRNNIQKKSGNYVPTDLFALSKYKSINAVLYSDKDPLNSEDRPEKCLQIILNPYNLPETNKTLMKVFNRIDIWYQKENGVTFWKCKKQDHSR